MIFTVLVEWISNALAILIGLLPEADASIVASISQYTETFRSLLANINWFFPVDTALFFLGMVFLIQFSLLAWKLLKYVAGILTVGILK